MSSTSEVLYQDLKKLFTLESVIQTRIEEKVIELENFNEKPISEVS